MSALETEIPKLEIIVFIHFQVPCGFSMVFRCACSLRVLKNYPIIPRSAEHTFQTWTFQVRNMKSCFQSFIPCVPSFFYQPMAMSMLTTSARCASGHQSICWPETTFQTAHLFDDLSGWAGSSLQDQCWHVWPGGCEERLGVDVEFTVEYLQSISIWAIEMMLVGVNFCRKGHGTGSIGRSTSFYWCALMMFMLFFT